MYGITDMLLEPREEIIALVKNNGAEYHGDLTKKVTHLIASTAGGKKYEHARRWDIKTVGPEWLFDSIERGMVLDDSLYSPTLAPEDRGKGAWTRLPNESVAAGKRKRGEEKAAEIAQGKRKLRRTMSAKLGSQHETMWADIAAAGSGRARQEEWHAQEEPDSVLGDLGAQNANLTPNPTIEPVRRRSTVGAAVSTSTQNGRLFGGALVYIHGFPPPKAAILSTHLESHGAQVCTAPAALLVDEDIGNGFMVVPHDAPEAKLHPIPTLATRLQRVTEWWVESCLATKVMVHPDQYPLCRPFAKLRIDGMRVSSHKNRGTY
jgi:DNA replication regulator DPB11